VKRFWILDFGFLIGISQSSRIFGLGLSAVLFTLCSSADAQHTKKIPRIGFLANSPSFSQAASKPSGRGCANLDM
jgi:hypothetical protein